MTVRQLSSSMTESELSQWSTYRARRELPTRRIELQLAQVCAWLARLAGNTNVSIDDFIIQKQNVTVVNGQVQADPQVIREEVKFAPRIVKKKRK